MKINSDLYLLYKGILTVLFLPNCLAMLCVIGIRFFFSGFGPKFSIEVPFLNFLEDFFIDF